MTLTLADARTQTQALLDSTGNARWSNTEIDIALKAARLSLFNTANGAGILSGKNTTTLQSNNGLIDISALKRAHIKSVSFLQSNLRIPLSPLGSQNVLGGYFSSNTYEITYSALPDYPTVTTDPILFCDTGVANEIMDALLCAKAALYMSAKEGATPQGLQNTVDRLTADLVKTGTQPRFSAMGSQTLQRMIPRLFWSFQDPETILISYGNWA